MKIAVFVIGIFLPVAFVGGFRLISERDIGKELDDGVECLTLKEIITNSATAAAISFYADHPRDNRTYDPNKVKPFSPTGLFKHYYGDEASAVQFKGAILELVYSAAQWSPAPTDRNTLRRNLYSYIAAGSREYARAKGGELFRIIIDEYAKDSDSWMKKQCIDPPILYDVLEAIEVECYRIRNEVGETKFGQFFALGVGSTLAFAIDDTGSMSGEIDAAKKRAQNIVDATRGTLDAPQDFVLVPFNDPEVGPVTVTNNAEEYHAALEKLYAHGGGDAPEMAVRGIQLAIENSRPGSIIYVITDVDAKDYNLQDTVIAQARQKSIIVTFMLTSSLNKCADLNGYKRCVGLYEFIAQQTGGKVLVISRGEIFRATDIVQAYAKQGVVLLKQVTIPSSKKAQHLIDFHVDNTIQELLLEAQGSCDNVHLIKPGEAGHAKLSAQRFGDVWTVNLKIDPSENQTLIGKWTMGVDVIKKNCTINIQGKTTLGFLLNVFNKGKDEPEDSYRILKSDPFVGDSVGLILDNYGFRVKNEDDVFADHVTALKFVTIKGKVLQTVPVEKSDGDVISHLFKDGISQMEPFRVVIEGKDTDGNTFERMTTKTLKTSHVRIDCDLSDLVFIAGEEAFANITIHNFGPTDQFHLKTADEKTASAFPILAFQNRVEVKDLDIAKDESVQLRMRFVVDRNTPDGTAIEITITAKGKLQGALQYTLCTIVVGQKRKPRIDAFFVTTTINARLAETKVVSLVTNDADIGREAEFDILLPQEAFITGITIKLPNETVHGVIEEKKKAKKVYDKAKAIGRVAGHVAAKDDSTRAFRTSMFVEPHQNVTFILTYHQLVKKVRGRYEYSVILNPDQPIRSLTVDVHIAEENNLLFVNVPPIKTTLSNIVDDNFPAGTSIDFNPSESTAHVHYEPDLNSQTKWSPKGLSGTFTVEYDVMRTELFGQISVDNGYFAHFFSPPDIRPTPKIVVFVVDTSGSMYGYKMEQMQDALVETLQSLNKEDRFNIVMFGDEAKPWMEGSMKYADEDTVSDAETFVQGSQPRGGTNVLDALNTAIELLEPYLPELPEPVTPEPEESSGMESNSTFPPVLPPVVPSIIEPVIDDSHLLIDDSLLITDEALEVLPPHDIEKREAEFDEDMENYAKMIVFLTDGRPSIGETDTKAIISEVSDKNQGRFILHTLGFGSLVDFKFLTKLSVTNNGTSRRVFEGIDADVQIRNFLEEVTNPLIRDVTIDYPSEQVDKLTTNTFSVFLAGTELIVAGQIRPDKKKEDTDLDLLGEGDTSIGSSKFISAQVRGRSFENEFKVIDFDVDPNKESKIKEAPHQIQNFTEKLWAFLQLKELLLQATLEDDKNKTEVINQKALNLSLKYEFVTPLTSLVVLRAKDRELIEQQLSEEEEKERKEELEKLKKEKEASEKAILFTSDEHVYESYEKDVSYSHAEDPRAYEDRSSSFIEDIRIPKGRERPRESEPRLLHRVSSIGRGGGGFSGDPHFIIPVLPDVNICFNWDGKEGEIYNFIYDPESGITVNGMLVNAPAPRNAGRQERTYVSKLAIVLPDLQKKILITPFEVIVVEEGRENFTLSAKSQVLLELGRFFSIKSTEVTKELCSLIIKCQGLEFSITLHRGKHGVHHANHLDFSLLNDLSSISRSSDGVFGQFAGLSTQFNQPAKIGVIGDEKITKDGQKRVHMYIRGKFISVVQRFMKMPGTDESSLCWYIHKNGQDAMRKSKSQFRMPSLFESPTIK